eukprot:15364883-Ditylum_brightwellii.AAC.2
MTNEYEVLRKQVKGLQSDKEKNIWSGLANGNRRMQRYSQQELNAIIGKSVKAALKKECNDHAQKETMPLTSLTLFASLQAMTMTSAAP